MRRLPRLRTLIPVLLMAGFFTVPQSFGQDVVSNPHGEFDPPLACTNCHTTEGWRPVKDVLEFSHDSFPLLGRHQLVSCTSCHTDLKFDEPKTAPNECATCHLDVHLGNFSSNCANCHNNNSFSDVDGIALHEQTSFPLTGAHLRLACQNCHTSDLGGAFASMDSECASCHMDDYDAATSIDHRAQGFPTQCEACHTTASWGGASFDHALASGGFELIGAHAPLACENCHTLPDLGLLFQPADNNDCITCHQQDYNNEHQGSGFPTTCLNCHGVDTWDGATFDHTAASGGFELVGAHAPLACENCHSMPDLGLLFQPADNNDCVTCHQQDYNNEHQGSGFPTTCLTCHNTNTWGNTTFDHTAASGGFELIGAHAPLACENCHTMPDLGLLFQPADNNDCVTCHQQDYNNEHQGSGFPTTCLNCHSVNSWDNATFDHTAASGGFELLGAHAPLACENCHTMPDLGLIFQPADNNDCITCHQQDYNNEHQGSGFPTTCLNCHSVNSWDNATFDHTAASGGFELLGAHAPLACENCHSMPDLGLIFQPADNNDCVTCHQQDYNNEHQGSGFPTTCLNCHSVNTWDGATFDHDGPYFPIYSGAHRGEWNSCQDCHDVPNDYQAFTCLTCHEHSQSRMDSKHGGRRGYAYESALCYSCHPRGRE